MERYDVVDPSGVRIICDRLTPTSDGLRAWVELRWEEKVVAYGNFNLMGPRTASALIKDAREAVNAKVNWADVVRGHLYDVILKHLAGADPVILADVPKREGAKWLLRPLVGATGASSIIGFGGSLKSLLALSAAASVATGLPRFIGEKPSTTGPVLYLDWEADAEEHSERLKALCKAQKVDAPSNILYRAEAAPMARSVGPISRLVNEEGIVMLVVDSVMLARGGDAFGPEDTTRLYGAIRDIGIPTLLIDHKAKHSKKTDGSYGSIVNENTARLQWVITSFKDEDPTFHIRLRQHKRNNVGSIGDIAYRCDFDRDGDELEGVTITPISAKTVKPMEDKSVRVRVWEYLLDDGGKTPADISDYLSIPANQVRTRLRELSDKGLASSMNGHWWALEEAT